MKIVLVYVGFSFLAFVKALSPSHPSKMCIIEENRKEDINEVEDCSFQFPSLKEKTCTILTRNVCTKKTSAYLQTIMKSNAQPQAKFMVEILPYAAVINFTYKTGESIETTVESDPSSAIKITFKTFPKDVTSIAFFMRDETLKFNFCRMIDFKVHDSGPNTHINNLFYDCFYHLSERLIKNVTFTLLYLPSHESFSYYVFIPSLASSNSLCEWKPLIMVFRNALKMGLVQIKFSTAPQHFKVTSYLVQLIPVNPKKEKYRIVQKDSSGGEMVNVEFSSVDEGYYYVSVKPFNLKDSACSFSITQTFYVAPPSNLGRDLALLVSSFILLSLCLGLALKYFYSKFFQYKELPYKQVLFVHSVDCLPHKKLVASFASYLTCLYGINVSTLYGPDETTNPAKWKTVHPHNTSNDIKNPREWIKRRYRDSDIIIFIISEGLYISLQDDTDLGVQEMTPWRNAPSRARYEIFESDNALKKKFCVVRFPYSEQIPHCLSDKGRSFQLPREMKPFLGFMFNLMPLVPFTNLYPMLARKDAASLQKERVFLDNIKIMQEAVENQVHIVKYRKSGSSKQNIEKDVQAASNKDGYVSVQREEHISSDEKDCESEKDGNHLYSKLRSAINDTCDTSCDKEMINLVMEVFNEDHLKNVDNTSFQNDLSTSCDKEILNHVLEVFNEDDNLESADNNY